MQNVLFAILFTEVTWTKYNGHCYHFGTKTVPWFAADVSKNMHNISSVTPLSSKQSRFVINEVYLESERLSEHFEDKCYNPDRKKNNTISSILKKK